MSEETVIEDQCGECSETIYYGDDGIACEWIDLAVEHECEEEYLD